jgi:hypothetical protein
VNVNYNEREKYICVVKHRKFMRKCFIPNHMRKHNSNIFNFMKSSFNLILCSTNISLTHYQTHFMFSHLLPSTLCKYNSQIMYIISKNHTYLYNLDYIWNKTNKFQRNKRRLIPWIVLKLTSSHGCFYMLNVQRISFHIQILHWYLFLC